MTRGRGVKLYNYSIGGFPTTPYTSLKNIKDNNNFTITYQDIDGENNSALVGLEVKIYKIADLVDDNNYELTTDYNGITSDFINLNYNNLSSYETWENLNNKVKDLNDKIYMYVNIISNPTFNSMKVDSSYSITNKLEAGLYFISASNSKTSDNFLLANYIGDKDESTIQINRLVTIKASTVPTPPPPPGS